MAKKKKNLNKTERREVRLRKARQWVLTYTGSHIARAYRKRFNIDYSCALKDLGEIGALQPERLALLQHHEQIRLEKKREQREAKREQEIYDRFPDSDDRFMFIAGYTSGGAPYGTTWEEMGLEPYQSLEDIPLRKPAKPRTQKPVLFAELGDKEKSEIAERLLELIDSFFINADYLPDDDDRDGILNELCDEVSVILNPWEKDLDPLLKIMSKPGIMYAWEHGFHKREVRKWLNNQYTRYHKDGYGYFAVILKDTGKLIGQAGLMKLELYGEKVVELGYIFDNRHWCNGYAIEASRACVDLAFGHFGQDKLYATIRPENTSSVKLAVKLGMRKIGELVKNYKDKDMPHDIYVLEKSQYADISGVK